MVDQIDIDKLQFGPDLIPLEGLDFFEISSDDDTREVMLAVFRSPLGSVLNTREPTLEEIQWLRNTVAQMIELADKTDAGQPNDYFIELVDGDDEVYQTISPSRRFVAGFEPGTWKSASPLKIELN